MISINKLFSFYFITLFSKRDGKRVLCVSVKLGKLQKVVETLPCQLVFRHLSSFQTST